MRQGGPDGKIQGYEAFPGNAPQSRRAEWVSPQLSSQEGCGASQARGSSGRQTGPFAGLEWESAVGALAQESPVSKTLNPSS